MLDSSIKQKELPTWEDLCIFNQNHFENFQIKNGMTKIKANQPFRAVSLIRFMMNLNKKDEAWKKFSNLRWDHAVDIMYDFYFRNQEEPSHEKNNSVKPVKINRRHSQQPCTNLTAKKRVDLVRQFCTKNDDILILGDDDHIGLYLAREGFKNVVSLDIDPFICHSLESSAKKEHLPLLVIHHDAKKKPPVQWQKNYKIIMIDPMYSVDGIKLFLNSAMEFAEKSQVDTVYFLNVHLLSLLPSGLEELNSYIEDSALEILHFYPALNRYPIPYLLKTMLNLFNRRYMKPQVVSSVSGELNFFLSDALILQKKQRTTDI